MKVNQIILNDYCLSGLGREAVKKHPDFIIFSTVILFESNLNMTFFFLTLGKLKICIIQNSTPTNGCCRKM